MATVTAKGGEVMVRFLELAGWGGGPGLVYGVTVHGPMVVSKHPTLEGLLQARVMKSGAYTTDRWVAARFAEPEAKYGTINGKRDTEYYLLPVGAKLDFPASAVRMMTEAS